MGDVVERPVRSRRNPAEPSRSAARWRGVRRRRRCYPKSWARRGHGGAHRIVGTGDRAALAELEKALPGQQRRGSSPGVHGRAHGAHARTRSTFTACPDITGVSCAQVSGGRCVRAVPGAFVPTGGLEAVRDRRDDPAAKFPDPAAGSRGSPPIAGQGCRAGFTPVSRAPSRPRDPPGGGQTVLRVHGMAASADDAAHENGRSGRNASRAGRPPRGRKTENAPGSWTEPERQPRRRCGTTFVINDCMPGRNTRRSPEDRVAHA